MFMCAKHDGIVCLQSMQCYIENEGVV